VTSERLESSSVVSRFSYQLSVISYQFEDYVLRGRTVPRGRAESAAVLTADVSLLRIENEDSDCKLKTEN
jgi:hypothetical protein